MVVPSAFHTLLRSWSKCIAREWYHNKLYPCSEAPCPMTGAAEAETYLSTLAAAQLRHSILWPFFSVRTC